MQWLSPVLLAIQVISSLSIIVLVLLQQGKGADMGSAFGSGSAGSLFGATGAANFLSRTTKWAAIIFFASTGGLAWVAHHPANDKSIIDGGVMQSFQSQEVPSTGAAVPVAPAVPSAPAEPSAPNTPAAGASSDTPAAASSVVPQAPSAEPSNTPAPSGDQPAADQGGAQPATTPSSGG